MDEFKVCTQADRLHLFFDPIFDSFNIVVGNSFFVFDPDGILLVKIINQSSQFIS